MAPLKAPRSCPNNSLSISVNDGGTIDRGKWSVLPAAVAVDVARDQLLSGSAFAENEHRRLGARHLADEIADLADRRTVPHDSLIDIGIVPKPLVFAFQQRNVTPVIQRQGGDAGDRDLQVEMSDLECAWN